MFKLCTNKNHSYKHNEQINSQQILKTYGFGSLYRPIGIFFTCGKNTFGHILLYYNKDCVNRKSYPYNWDVV